MSSLKPFGEKIWIFDGPRVRMMTIPFTTRMTVVEVEPGYLWVHSPLQPSGEMLEAIRSLGQVKYIIAPNKIHSLGIKPWKDHFPSAEVWVSPKFCERHPNIQVDHVIQSKLQTPWATEINCFCFEGSRFLDEVVFFHKRSRTLILTDLIQRHDPAEDSWFWRFIKRAAGVLGPSGGTARDLRGTFHDRQAARRSARAILNWDFNRVIISHGSCITGGAHNVVEQAFRWVLE